MQRHILQSLSQWKRKPNRKPLIIQGARQVGKTWVMKTFGAAEFEQVAYINFDNNPQMQALFGGDFDINRLLLGLSIEAGVSINADNTLLIFDEIQAVPQALTALKYFYEKAPHLPIIAAGSLLGVALHQGVSFPVGKVEFLPMYPMDFGPVAIARLGVDCGDENQIHRPPAPILFCRRYARGGADFCRYARRTGGALGAAKSAAGV